MAALLKKRALAEYQSQTVVQQPTPKKLRLIKKRKPSGLTNQATGDHNNVSLESDISALDTPGQSSGDTFKLLSKIAAALPATVSTLCSFP